MISFFVVGFAAFFVLVLIGFLLYASPGAKKKADIPGPPPTDKLLGNLPDIGKAGSLHQYLTQLHAEFGPLVGFYYGQQFFVSLASAGLQRETVRLFDRPAELYRLFEPLIGAKSIQFANGADGRTRRTAYDRAFSHEAVGRVVPVLDECAEELAAKLRSCAARRERVPLVRFCVGLAIKAILRVAVEPNRASLPDEQVAQLKTWYDLAWTEMEARLEHGEPESGDHRMQVFNEAVSNLKNFVDQTVRRRSGRKFDSELDKTLADLVVEQHGQKDPEAVRSDVLTYLVGGFHTSGTLIAWALYYAIVHPEYADRLRRETAEVIGGGEFTMAAIGQMAFHRAFLDETMRLACLAPFASRVLEAECEIGGHVLPAGTGLIQALGVAGMSCELVDRPDEFDPDRRPPAGQFEPFGWGRRKCPGYRLAYAEVALWLSRLLCEFELRLVDPEFVAVPDYGLVTKPKAEIWVLVEARAA